MVSQNLVNTFFPGLPFDAASLNFTSESCSTWHRDFKNLVWGVCCIGPLGNFDWTVSGQFMMDELRCIIELRPGDLFFVPSGAIRHANAPLKNPSIENRYAIVFYSAGGNFRWIANNFKKQDDNRATKERIKEGARRWEEGWALFNTLSDIQ
jgi:hypothetical protein